METELILASPDEKKTLQPKVRQYSMQLKETKNEFTRASENYLLQQSKEMLMKGTSPRTPTELEETKGTKAKLLTTYQEKVQAQNWQLENAKKTIYETDKVSIEIMDNLGNQNVRAAGTRSKVKEVFSYLGESNSVITRMLRREKLTKFALAGIMGIVVMALLFIVYKKILG